MEPVVSHALPSRRLCTGARQVAPPEAPREFQVEAEKEQAGPVRPLLVDPWGLQQRAEVGGRT